MKVLRPLLQDIFPEIAIFLKFMNRTTFVLLLFYFIYFPTTFSLDELPACNQLQSLQYQCEDPPLDSVTNEYANCNVNGTVKANCSAIDEVECLGDRNFSVDYSCRYTNGYYYHKALALSIFLGPLGVDRFYLGYPAIGLIKLFTFGGFLVGNWIDFIMISVQRLKPADGSEYIMKKNGPLVYPVRFTNETYIIPHSS